jgi:tRNA nucleotidyltransferase (CCA-adding enzyme)
MNVYLVGGAVRDQLLDFPVRERDWVVLGQTPQQMLDQGFKAVGKNFPVFLHPETKDEYALARTERKTSPGYKGFVVHTDPDVSLEEDLQRRDLTINAMARISDGEIFDPFGGQQDLQLKILRHISPAFTEDPVRVLRVARFYARFAHLGFQIAPETKKLMHTMVNNGEIDHLVAERVWAETTKALAEKTPSAYFKALKDCGALAIIFPELDQLYGVPQPKKYHPEIDTGIHSLLALDQAAFLSKNIAVRFAALVHDLGKATTPKIEWPSHHGHETRGLPILESLCKRLRVPNQTHKLAAQVMRYHTHCHRIFDLRSATIVDMLTSLGVFKSTDKLGDFLLACEADAKGRTGLENTPYPQATFCLAAQQAAAAVDTKQIVLPHLRGAEIGQAIREIRIKAVKICKHQLSP